MRTIAFRKKWHLTDNNFNNVNGLCSRDFDEETGRLHVRNYSEKWDGSHFFCYCYSLFCFSCCFIFLIFPT